MKPNPILEETWRIKDQLAREADYDIQKLCAQTRSWTDANLHTSPLTRDLDELEAARSALREVSDTPS